MNAEYDDVGTRFHLIPALGLRKTAVEAKHYTTAWVLLFLRLLSFIHCIYTTFLCRSRGMSS